MLKSVFIIICKVIVVVWVEEVFILLGEDVAGAEVRSRQACFFGLFNLKYVLDIILQVFAHFITQVGRGISVTDDLGWLLHADGAVVCTNDQFDALCCHFTKCGPHW